VRKLHAYTSFEQCPAMCESGEVPVDELTADADRPLDDATRVARCCGRGGCWSAASRARAGGT
jgi:hypothetical protein